MTTTHRSTGNREWVGRVTLTLITGGGALAAMLFVSNALAASDRIDRFDGALATLSSFVETSHAAMRERITSGESLDDAIAAFDAGVERRLATIQAALKQPAGAARWTSEALARLDLRVFAQDRRAYVDAAEIAAAAPGDRSALVRRFDLVAQKLRLTMDAAHDAVEPSRAAALGDANAAVTLGLGVGALVIMYLVWLPVFGPPSAQLRIGN